MSTIDAEKAWHPSTGNPRLAHSLIQGINELDALFPRRTQGLQEGTIGDDRHKETNSDHNPWVKDPSGAGVVRAWDIDVTGHDFDPQQLADHLAELMRRHHPMFGSKGYVIYNRRITSWIAWATWTGYNGDDPHTQHIHVSVGLNQAEYDSKAPWGLAALFNPPPQLPHTIGGTDDMLIITPGAEPLPVLVSGGRAIQILDGPSWHNLGLAGVKTVQITRRDYDAIMKGMQ